MGVDDPGLIVDADASSINVRAGPGRRREDVSPQARFAQR